MAQSGEDSHLITPSSIDNVDDAIAALGTKLQDHSLLSYVASHGDWINFTTNCFSITSGTRIARRKIRIKIGTQFYFIPADPSITGPPTFPVITVHPSDLFSNADAGESQPPVTFQITATGLHPLRFTWQIYDCSLPGQFVNFNYVDAVLNTSVVARDSTVKPTIINTVQLDSTTSSSSMRITINPNGEVNQNPATFIRCKVDNLEVDGGEVISNPVNTQWNGTQLIPASRPVGGAKLRVRNET